MPNPSSASKVSPSATMADGSRLYLFGDTQEEWIRFTDLVKESFPSHHPHSHGGEQTLHLPGVAPPDSEACEEPGCRLWHAMPVTSNWENPNRRRMAIIVSAAAPSRVGEDKSSMPTEPFSHHLLYESIGRLVDTFPDNDTVFPPRSSYGAAEPAADETINSVSTALSSGRFCAEPTNPIGSETRPKVEMSRWEIVTGANVDDRNDLGATLTMGGWLDEDHGPDLKEIQTDVRHVTETFAVSVKPQRPGSNSQVELLVGNGMIPETQRVLHLFAEGLEASEKSV